MAEAGQGTSTPGEPEQPQGIVAKLLGWVEKVGNRLPDPAFLFLFTLLLVWVASLVFAGYEFSVPARDGVRILAVQNQLTGQSLAVFLSSMVTTFTGFAPLGVVLVGLPLGLSATYVYP